MDVVKKQRDTREECSLQGHAMFLGVVKLSLHPTTHGEYIIFTSSKACTASV